MAKGSTYVCQQCGYQSPSYLGKCPNCDAWGSLVETIEEGMKGTIGRKGKIREIKPVKIEEIGKVPLERIKTSYEEFNRCLGGGIVAGSVILLSGEPGIGKSTLLLQIAANLGGMKGMTGKMSDDKGEGSAVLYVSGEESLDQIKVRYDRLKDNEKTDLLLASEVDVDSVIETAEKVSFRILIADSIQALRTDDLNSPPGSISQVRECAYRLHRLAKEKGISVILVGHVTKEGVIAGPKVLEHLVDTVLYLEGEQFSTFRILRSTKNRYGPLDEIGVFEMADAGLKEVTNPSEIFLKDRVKAPGSVVIPVLEGSRVLLTEIQALTSRTEYPLPRRVSSGVDQNRLNLILATLGKRAGVRLANLDIFVSVAGGLKVYEPAADLGIALAITSSVYDKIIKEEPCVFGEVGLLGEIRSVTRLEQRIKEAGKQGFKKFVTPKEARTLKEAIKLAFS